MTTEADSDELASRGDFALQAAVAEALFNKAVALGDSGDLQASVDVYRELRTRFSRVQDPVVRAGPAVTGLLPDGRRARCTKSAEFR